MYILKCYTLSHMDQLNVPKNIAEVLLKSV